MLTLKQVRMIVLAHLAYIQYLSILLSTNIQMKILILLKCSKK